MVYQVKGDKFAWAAEQDNVRKAIRGTAIIDYNGFKVENSYDSDLAVAVKLGGAAEIKGTSVYWSDLKFALDTQYVIDDCYETRYETLSSLVYRLHYDANEYGVKQTFEPAGGFVNAIKFYAKVNGTVSADLRVEIWDETNDQLVTYDTVAESSLSTTISEVTWTLPANIILDPDIAYSIRWYRADLSSPTDTGTTSTTNYYSIGYSLGSYSYGSAYQYTGAAWTAQTYQTSFYISRYDYTWEAQAQSAISLESSIYTSSPHSLKWIYTDDGATQYSNRVTRRIAPNKQDWTKRNKVRFMFYPAATLEHNIYVGIKNNGTEYALGTILPGDVTAATWNVVEFDAPTYRDQVENIFFYVDGNQWSTGTHIFYIDDIFVYKKIDLVAPSVTDYGRIDLVYLDDDGVIDIKTGTEVDLNTDTPKPEDLDLNELGLALISVQYGDTSLTSDDIVDIRSPLNEEL